MSSHPMAVRHDTHTSTAYRRYRWTWDVMRGGGHAMYSPVKEVACQRVRTCTKRCMAREAARCREALRRCMVRGAWCWCMALLEARRRQKGTLQAKPASQTPPSTRKLEQCDLRAQTRPSGPSLCVLHFTPKERTAMQQRVG